MVNLKQHEEMFEIRPVGIRYKCEFCNEGEMIYNNPGMIAAEDFYQKPIMHNHVCNKCGKEMLLPKMYPYVEWTIPINEDQLDNE